MTQINDYSQLGGIWKDVWGNSVFDPFKFLTPIISDMPLEAPASEAGGKYHQPIMVTQEAGITHAAPRTTPGYGSAIYVNPNAGQVPDWQIEGAQIYGRSLVTYEAMMRSLKDVNGSEEDLRKAVKSSSKIVMNSLGRALAKRGEVLAINGGMPEGLGTIEAVGTTPVATTYQGTAGFYNDVSISSDTWAQAIFAAAEGSTYDIYTTTKQNAGVNTALGSVQTGLILIGLNPASLVSPVTATGRVLRFFHTINGATGITSLAAGRNVFYETGGPGTSSVGSEPYGLSYIASIGTSGFGVTSLYGLDSANYSMVAGNRVTGVGNVKIAQLIEYLASPIDYGVIGMKVRALAPTRLFQQLAADEASLRRYNGEQKKAKNGFSAIEYNMGGNNVLEVLGHPFQKGGRVTCYVPEEAHRVGPQDVSFLTRKGGEYVLEVAGGAASEMRAMGQYNLYCDTPRHMLVLEGVTY